jgi:hypothetical protein
MRIRGGRWPGSLRSSADGRRKGFTEADYARLLDAAHQQLGGSLVVVWDNLNTHVSHAMADLIAARPRLTVCQLPSPGSNGCSTGQDSSTASSPAPDSTSHPSATVFPVVSPGQGTLSALWRSRP